MHLRHVVRGSNLVLIGDGPGSCRGLRSALLVSVACADAWIVGSRGAARSLRPVVFSLRSRPVLCSLHSRSGGISRETETDKEMQACVLCGRDIPQHLLSRHHLVPKLRGGRSTEENLVLMHRPCHDKVHAVFTETQLARDYHSVDSLLADPDISKFVRWIQKRPIDFSDSTMSVRRRQQRMQRRK